MASTVGRQVAVALLHAPLAWRASEHSGTCYQKVSEGDCIAVYRLQSGSRRCEVAAARTSQPQGLIHSTS
jgi:hypothetical protein